MDALRAQPVVLTSTAAALLGLGLWCVVELRADDRPWEPRLLICERDSARVLAVVADWELAPGEQLRIAGYTRDTLRRVAFAPRAR
jgi:hypothetical protein